MNSSKSWKYWRSNPMLLFFSMVHLDSYKSLLSIVCCFTSSKSLSRLLTFFNRTKSHIFLQMCPKLYIRELVHMLSIIFDSLAKLEMLRIFFELEVQSLKTIYDTLYVVAQRSPKSRLTAFGNCFSTLSSIT